MFFFLKTKIKCAFLYQLIDGIFSHHPFKTGNNISHTKGMDWFKAHLGLSFFFYWYPLLISPIPRNSAHMETPVLQCWKTVLPNDRRNFFRDEDDRLLILILVASFIIISMIVIIGVVRFFSYCILSLLLSLSSLLGGQLRSSLLWGRSLLFWCRVTGVKVKAVTPKLYNDVAHPWFKLQKWKSWIQER